MNKPIKKGDWVRVYDPGLLMLQRFDPPGSRPNNEARVYRFDDDGTVEVAFPLGDDPIEVHSQASLYQPHELTVIEKPAWYAHEDQEAENE